MTREELKIEALSQRIAELTAGYEVRIADLRVELTLLSDQLVELKKASGDENVEVADTSKSGTSETDK